MQPPIGFEGSAGGEWYPQQLAPAPLTRVETPPANMSQLVGQPHAWGQPPSPRPGHTPSGSPPGVSTVGSATTPSAAMSGRLAVYSPTASPPAPSSAGRLQGPFYSRGSSRPTSSSSGSSAASHSPSPRSGGSGGGSPASPPFAGGAGASHNAVGTPAHPPTPPGSLRPIVTPPLLPPLQRPASVSTSLPGTPIGPLRAGPTAGRGGRSPGVLPQEPPATSSPGAGARVVPGAGPMRGPRFLVPSTPPHAHAAGASGGVNGGLSEATLINTTGTRRHHHYRRNPNHSSLSATASSSGSGSGNSATLSSGSSAGSGGGAGGTGAGSGGGGGGGSSASTVLAMPTLVAMPGYAFRTRTPPPPSASAPTRVPHPPAAPAVVVHVPAVLAAAAAVAGPAASARVRGGGGGTNGPGPTTPGAQLHRNSVTTPPGPAIVTAASSHVNATPSRTGCGQSQEARHSPVPPAASSPPAITTPILPPPPSALPCSPPPSPPQQHRPPLVYEASATPAAPSTLPHLSPPKQPGAFAGCEGAAGMERAASEAVAPVPAREKELARPASNSKAEVWPLLWWKGIDQELSEVQLKPPRAFFRRCAGF